MKTRTTVAVFVVASAIAASAQTAKPAAKPPAAQHAMVNASDLQWGQAPPSLPAGAQLAVLHGDPAAAGVPFVMRVKFPDGFKVPPHWHPSDENVTVIAGTLAAGVGETWDDSAMKTFNPGGFALMPAKTPHYVVAKGETIVQIHAVGPFAVTYVDPKDDPRKKPQ